MTNPLEMFCFAALRQRRAPRSRTAIVIVVLASGLMATACDGGQYVRHIHRRGVAGSQRQRTLAKQQHTVALALKYSHRMQTTACRTSPMQPLVPTE
jgi:hypothetical protein